MGKKDNRPGHNPHRPNIWGMFSNISLAAIGKGQLQVLMSGVIVLVAVVKLPPEDVSEFLNGSYKALLDLAFMGWGLFFVTAILFLIITRQLRRSHAREMNRISDEKKQLQEHVLQQRMGSSKQRASKKDHV